MAPLIVPLIAVIGPCLCHLLLLVFLVNLTMSVGQIIVSGTFAVTREIQETKSISHHFSSYPITPYINSKVFKLRPPPKCIFSQRPSDEQIFIA